MIKKLLTVFVFLVVVIALQQCKPDSPYNCNGCNEPDSLYVGVPVTLQKPFKFPSITIPPDNPLTEEGILLGRMLFYDSILSVSNSLACASCHKQEFAFSDAGNALSQNVFGPTKRNTPPLMNLVWMKDFFWDGRSSTLPNQADDALLHELGFDAAVVIPRLEAKPEYVRLFKKAFGRPGTITQEKIEKAIAQFEMTLISANSKFDKVMRGEATFTPEESRGFYNLFMKDTIDKGADCFHCHASSSSSSLTMIDDNFHNNGLVFANSFNDFADKGRGAITNNMLDNGKFRTPHLRNIEVTGPYMHAGQFTTLEQVVDFYNDSLKMSPTVDPQIKAAHRGGLKYLTAQDKADLIAFLKTLTDTAFLHNPAFSNPFK
jgi:cytochrome c peroxidase